MSNIKSIISKYINLNEASYPTNFTDSKDKEHLNKIVKKLDKKYYVEDLFDPHQNFQCGGTISCSNADINDLAASLRKAGAKNLSILKNNGSQTLTFYFKKYN